MKVDFDDLFGESELERSELGERGEESLEKEYRVPSPSTPSSPSTLSSPSVEFNKQKPSKKGRDIQVTGRHLNFHKQEQEEESSSSLSSRVTSSRTFTSSSHESEDNEKPIKKKKKKKVKMTAFLRHHMAIQNRATSYLQSRVNHARNLLEAKRTIRHRLWYVKRQIRQIRYLRDKAGELVRRFAKMAKAEIVMKYNRHKKKQKKILTRFQEQVKTVKRHIVAQNEAKSYFSSRVHLAKRRTAAHLVLDHYLEWGRM